MITRRARYHAANCGYTDTHTHGGITCRNRSLTVTPGALRLANTWCSFFDTVVTYSGYVRASCITAGFSVCRLRMYLYSARSRKPHTSPCSNSPPMVALSVESSHARRLLRIMSRPAGRTCSSIWHVGGDPSVQSPHVSQPITEDNTLQQYSMIRISNERDQGHHEGNFAHMPSHIHIHVESGLIGSQPCVMRSCRSLWLDALLPQHAVSFYGWYARV